MYVYMYVHALAYTTFLLTGVKNSMTATILFVAARLQNERSDSAAPEGLRTLATRSPYVCLCVYVCICIYTYIYVYKLLKACAPWLRAHHPSVCVCVYVCMCVCMRFLCVCVCIYIYIYIYIYILR